MQPQKKLIVQQGSKTTLMATGLQVDVPSNNINHPKPTELFHLARDPVPSLSGDTSQILSNYWEKDKH